MRWKRDRGRQIWGDFGGEATKLDRSDDPSEGQQMRKWIENLRISFSLILFHTHSQWAKPRAEINSGVVFLFIFPWTLFAWYKNVEFIESIACCLAKKKNRKCHWKSTEEIRFAFQRPNITSSYPKNAHIDSHSTRANEWKKRDFFLIGNGS